MIKNFLNPEGNQNPFNGSKVTVILLKGWIWLLVELHGEGSACSLRIRLVYGIMIIWTYGIMVWMNEGIMEWLNNRMMKILTYEIIVW